MWLKGSSVWGSIDSLLVNFMWRYVTFKHFNLEFDVWPEWNFEIINWGDSSGTTISVESWAVESSMITFMKFWESNIKTVEGLSRSNSNLEWSSITSFFGSINDSSITKNSSPVESSPVWCGTEWSFSLFSSVNSDSWKIVVGNRLSEVFSVSSVNVWFSYGIDSLGGANKSKDCCWDFIHIYNIKFI